MNGKVELFAGTDMGPSDSEKVKQSTHKPPSVTPTRNVCYAWNPLKYNKLLKIYFRFSLFAKTINCRNEIYDRVFHTTSSPQKKVKLLFSDEFESAASYNRW